MAAVKVNSILGLHFIQRINTKLRQEIKFKANMFNISKQLYIQSKQEKNPKIPKIKLP